jgi:hypothetical protein
MQPFTHSEPKSSINSFLLLALETSIPGCSVGSSPLSPTMRASRFEKAKTFEFIAMLLLKNRV